MVIQKDSSVGKGFSILLKRLRREVRGWTQKELAAKSGLKLRTIQDLETAQKANLDHETISYLADAFELEGSAKEEFFKAAGLAVVSPALDNVEWAKLIYEFYKSMEFPAFVSDELANVNSLNAYMIDLLEMKHDKLAAVVNETGRLNALRFFLDPAFNAKKIYGNQWTDYTTLNAWFLRNLSRPYIHTQQYQIVLLELQQFEDFADIWEASAHVEMPLPPYLGTVHTTKYGTVRFWHSSAVRPNIRGEQMTFLFYHPADPESECAFAQMRAAVPKMAYQFSNTKGKGVVRIF
jgi:transcriptional regulator with XRE-family HTH domain